MNVSPLTHASAYLGQSLIYDRPVVIQESAGVSSSFSAQASVTPATVTQKIEDIAANPNLTDKQKRGQMNDLRKQLGLSKSEMKKNFMKPLEQKAAQEGDEAKRKLYASMYKPGGCVKKVFKGIGKGLMTAGKVALGVASAIYNPMSLIPQAVSLIGQIPGVGKAVNYVSGALNTVSDWVDKGAGLMNEAKDFFGGE